MLAVRQTRRVRYALAAMAAASAGAGVWLLRAFDPNAPGNLFLPCLFRQFTGLYCPGCGTTRALHALVHGDLGGFIAMNPLLAVVAPGLLVVTAHGMGYRLRLPPALMDVLLGARFWLILIFGYWVARNLPWWPFSWLAPG